MAYLAKDFLGWWLFKERPIYDPERKEWESNGGLSSPIPLEDIYVRDFLESNQTGDLIEI